MLEWHLQKANPRACRLLAKIGPSPVHIVDNHATNRSCGGMANLELSDTTFSGCWRADNTGTELNLRSGTVYGAPI